MVWLLKSSCKFKMKNENDIFAIDLLWVRVGKVGGTESFIRNLMDGMCLTKKKFRAVLLAAEDNQNTFLKYLKDERFSLVCCPVCSNNIKKRLFWQNFKMSHFLKQRGISKCFVPIYSIPLLGSKYIKYYAVIHDLQAYHFPEYFSNARNKWMCFEWKNTIKKAYKVIAISQYTKQDIIDIFHVPSSRIEMIYNPIAIQKTSNVDSARLIKKIGVEPEQYFFCVTSLLPHKNLKTLLQVMKERKDLYKLLICGVGGPMKKMIENDIQQSGLRDRVIIAPFVDDFTRDALYQNCRIFLFPSVFEGFGMPPVEAMLAGRPVITTKCTSIQEVTHGEASYVENPYDATEWNRLIDQELLNSTRQSVNTYTIAPGKNPYSTKNIAEQYLDLLLL